LRVACGLAGLGGDHLAELGHAPGERAAPPGQTFGPPRETERGPPLRGGSRLRDGGLDLLGGVHRVRPDDRTGGRVERLERLASERGHTAERTTSAALLATCQLGTPSAPEGPIVAFNATMGPSGALPWR